MKFLANPEALQMLCEKTNMHALKIMLPREGKKEDREEGKTTGRRRYEDFMNKLTSNEILKKRFSQDINKKNSENYNQMSWTITLSDNLIFAEETIILEIIKVFEEVKGSCYHYYNPKKMIIRVFVEDTQQYDTF
jgi:hypothetical protein